MELATHAGKRAVIGFTELKERYLPHRYPLLLIDRVTDYEPGVFIEAVKAVTGNSPDLVGHFPDRAIMPGTSVVQAFAQLAIVFFKVSNGPLRDDEITVISTANARFLAPVPPGVLLNLRMTAKRLTASTGIFSAVASVDGRDVARGSITLAKAPLDRFRHVPW